jgi:hypothetical protein
MIAARAGDHNFSRSDFFFSALRFMVAVITTLAFVLAPALRPLSEFHVRFVGAGETDPRLELFVTNGPRANFLVLKRERD